MTTYRLLPGSLPLLLAVTLASGCVIPMPVGDGADDAADDANSGDVGETEPGTASDDGATSMDDASSETDGLEDYPDCPAPTAVDTTLEVAVDGAILDPFDPPASALLYVQEAACTASGSTASTVVVECPDIDGQAHLFELVVESSPAVALPASGTAVSLMLHYETDDLSDALMNWALTLREGSADGPLLLALNGGSYLNIPGLEFSLGSTELCPEQEVDALCHALRRTTVAIDVQGASLASFDHGSVDAEDGSLRMVVGDAAWRTISESFDEECPGGGGGLPGRFELVIGPPA